MREVGPIGNAQTEREPDTRSHRDGPERRLAPLACRAPAEAREPQPRGAARAAGASGFTGKLRADIGARADPPLRVAVRDQLFIDPQDRVPGDSQFGRQLARRRKPPVRRQASIEDLLTKPLVDLLSEGLLAVQRQEHRFGRPSGPPIGSLRYIENWNFWIATCPTRLACVKGTMKCLESTEAGR